MVNGLNEHEISTALLDESDCDMDQNFFPGSEDESDLFSYRSRHESGEEVEENTSDVEPSSSQPFYVGREEMKMKKMKTLLHICGSKKPT